MVPISELTENEQATWRSWLTQWLAYQNHTGRHMYRYLPSPLNPTKREFVCWKCGKQRP